MPSLDLVSGEEALIPAQYCIFIEYPCGAADCVECKGREDAWCVTTSNGTAVASPPAAACLSGLLELIERDTFMLMCYHQLRFPYLRPDPYTRLSQRVSRMFGASRIDVRLISLTEVHDVRTAAHLTRLLQERDIRTYAVDLTPADTPPDLFSYNVVSPELIPLDCDHRARHLNHALEEVHAEVAADQLRGLGSEPELLESVPAIVLINGLFWRSRFKYKLRGYLFAPMASGAVIQQLTLVAQAQGWGALPFAGLFDDQVEELCEINAVLLGRPLQLNVT